MNCLWHSIRFTLVAPAQTYARQCSNFAAISRAKRVKYPRLYPVTVVNSDGSTYTIRYKEPRQIIKLPLDFESLAEPEQLKVLALRKPRKTKKKMTVFDDTGFNATDYLGKIKT